MSDADDAPLTPLQLVKKLEVELSSRQVTLQRLRDYYDGKHRLAFSSEKFRQAFGGMFSAFADNFIPLVVNSVEQRLNVEGFRHGDDPKSDRDAWGIWQRNGLDGSSQLAHSEALTVGDSYAIVWADDEGQPRITIESPRDVVVTFKPGDRTCRVAALKRWRDDDGDWHATLFTPDAVYKFEREADDLGEWKPDIDTNEPWPLVNPLGVVPVVPLTNDPTLVSPYGRSEFMNVIPQQDAINKLAADLLVASEYIAFPQRYVTGLELPEDEHGNVKAPFQVALDKLLVAEDPNARFGTLSAGDLDNYVKGMEFFIQNIATQTATPPHYFYLGGNFPSGDAIKSAEAGLVAKARRKTRFFGEAWEEVMRLAFKVINDPRGDVMTGETIWADPEFRSEAELADALVKRASIGVPRQQLWEDAGYSQTQIARFHAMEADDALSSFLSTPAPAPQQLVEPAPGGAEAS